MSVKHTSSELSEAVRYALETTRAVAVCPFHLHVIIRVGDDAAETHAFLRARNLRSSDGKSWKQEDLRKEFRRQLDAAADHHCPECAKPTMPDGRQC
jgi:hypothetical protein